MGAVAAKVFEIAGSIAVFIYGMRVMSDGLQKIAGTRLQAVLNYMTMNRVAAVFTGMLVTGVIQSSSATTIMVVTFVNAGLLKLTQAIGVIMGANIGTTVTGWIVSVIGFKFSISAIAMPVIACGFPLMFSKDKTRKELSEVLIGFGLLFLGLDLLKNAVPDFRNNPEALDFLARYANIHWAVHFVLFLATGTILTILMQSSSATMAVTITLAFKGVIDFPSAATMVLGENVGTTIKANLVAIGAHVNARRAARVHTIFNLAGVLWMVILFTPPIRPHFFAFIDAIVPGELMVHTNGGTEYISQNIPMHLSMFHSLFNAVNTLIFIWFVPNLAAFVSRLVPASATDERRQYHLRYIASPGQDTAAINLINARKEVRAMGQIVVDMVGMLTELLANLPKKMGKVVEDLQEREEITDTMQEEISRFLAQCSGEGLPDRTADEVAAMIRIVNEFEELGDCCYKLVLLANRAHDKRMFFQEDHHPGLEAHLQRMREFMEHGLSTIFHNPPPEWFDETLRMERDIEAARRRMVKTARRRIQDGADIKTELLFIDILSHCRQFVTGVTNVCRECSHFTT